MDKDRDDTLLVIRLSAMGDAAMTVPVLLSLVRCNPSLKLLVLTRPFFAPIFRDIPNTEVFSIDLKKDHKGISGLYRLSKQLKSHRLQGIADLHNVLRTKILRILFTGSSLPFVQIDKGRKEKRKLTSWKHKELRPLKSTHERYADVFRQMGFTLELSPQDVLMKRRVSKEVESILPDKAIKVVGIAPFAAFPGKMYPLELMDTVLKKLNDTNQYKIVLFGGGSREISVLEGFEKKYTSCFSAAGKLTFNQELGLISHLDLMVSMDSGNGHLAAMFGIPTITLWGNTHPYAWFTPYNQPPSLQILTDRDRYPFIPTSVYGNKYPKGYKEAMESIAPDTVVEKILSTLEE